ncbi:hypothetical protein OQA88_4044 [Cercophora sp. LCS_1]
MEQAHADNSRPSGLHIPRPEATETQFFLQRVRWQLFTIFFPEVTVSLAAEQWESANQGVAKFKELGHPWWSQRHAFFADMGGIVLESPGFPPFPIDWQQLAYLVENGYVPMPNITNDDIADKSKADGFARALAVVQIVWFTLQCVGRWAQNLGLCTLELSTLAFIFCSLNMQYFWYFKPYDIRSPFVIHTEYPMRTVLLQAGDAARHPYSRTPLDFVKPPPDDRSLIAPFWFGVESIISVLEDRGRRPIRCFSNHKTMPPAGITARERLYGVFLELFYFGLHFMGLLLEFPSRVERALWVAANGTLTTLLVVYMIAIYVGHKVQARFGMWLFGKKTESIMGLIEVMPRWAKVIIHGPFIFVYVIARGYVLVEGFLGLRALPPKLFVTVEWANFLLHL